MRNQFFLIPYWLENFRWTFKGNVCTESQISIFSVFYRREGLQMANDIIVFSFKKKISLWLNLVTAVESMADQGTIVGSSHHFLAQEIVKIHFCSHFSVTFRNFMSFLNG